MASDFCKKSTKNRLVAKQQQARLRQVVVFSFFYSITGGFEKKLKKG
jgi:hypothetical protein